ncbi:MAG: hypothetical protein SPG34_08850 [Trueperella sp.]|uniref:hypothetical protein n=1 Tax=Trueperella sp. TaxID=2699835 RepID=UPI002A9178FA|nr:hypothetical protein [Trueperella sp.]MDY5404423.1 hypothetical protein [Trueperella sp.]
MTTARNEIIALYDQYVAEHPDGATTMDVRDYLTARMGERLADRPRDLTAEATHLVGAHLPKIRAARKDLLRTNLTRILEYVRCEDRDLDVTAIAVCAFPTGDTIGIDKTLRYWTAEDIHTWLEARAKNWRTARAAYDLDADAGLAVTHAMATAHAFTIGDLITDTKEEEATEPVKNGAEFETQARELAAKIEQHRKLTARATQIINDRDLITDTRQGGDVA